MFGRSVRRWGQGGEVVLDVERTCARSSERVGCRQVVSEAVRTGQFKPRPHHLTAGPWGVDTAT